MTAPSESPRHVVAVSGFVRNADHDVLLVRVASRGWEMPGGQVEQGESLLEALRREVEEECGCIVEPERLLSVDSRISAPAMVVHVFACRHVRGTPEAREDSVPEAGWFAPGRALELVTRSPAADRLRDALTPHAALRVRTYRMRPYELVDELML